MTTVTRQQPKGRVCVGLSGGVDSSVTAALLVQEGYDVVGVYMNNWNTQSPSLGRHQLDSAAYRMKCPWYEDYLDAKRVALQLGIPFEMWDFREAYKQKVFDQFLDEIAKGRTPNPDIYCNSQLKFDDFLGRALAHREVEAIATGHYADLVETNNHLYLKIPKDTHKDQTYFLYRLNQDQLKHALFPLAHYTKAEVRQLAKQFNLPTQQKKDSQGLCFIGQVDIQSFISQWFKPKPGQIIDEQGSVIGQHDGVHLYTIGQKIAVENEKVATLYPDLKQQIPTFYIASKDIKKNQLVAVPGFEHPFLYKESLELEDVVLHQESDLDAIQFARLRHGGQLIPVKSCRFETKSKIATVELAEPQRAIAPGQHLVFYSQDHRVLGGGVIS